ncbi:hypothetical protein CXG81DRAFT_4887, partial [Caulochytrium protostelioides]
RTRLMISDGRHYCIAMTRSQQSPLVYSLIRIFKSIHQTIKDRHVLMLATWEIASEPVEKIGSPVDLSEPKSEPPPQVNPSSTNSSYAANKPASGYTPQKDSNGGYGGGMDDPATKRITSISGLNPYQTKWMIRARCTQKSDIRKWSNARGEGQLFSCTLTDATGEIRVTAFKESVNQFYPLLENDQVYYISGGAIKPANKQFSNVQNEYELVFDHNTTIRRCTDGTHTSVPGTRYQAIDLSQLGEKAKDDVVDIVAIVKEVGDTSSITSKTSGRAFQKRELVVVDTSGYQVRLTLWGADAENLDVRAAQANAVIALKGAKVGDFGGRTLSLPMSGAMALNPDFQEAHRLKGWWSAEGSRQTFASFSSGEMGLGGSGMTRDERDAASFRFLAEAKAENLGGNEKPDYFGARATVTYIRQENFAYPACSSEGCQKKVIDNGDGWRCEKCNKLFDAPNWRFIFALNISDATGQIWAQVFNDQAELLLGTSANDLMALRDRDQAAMTAVFNNVLNNTYAFRLRAKSEIYQDENQIRYAAMSILPVDYAQASRHVIKMIEQLEI